MKEQYFLGANSPLGFFSLYEYFMNAQTDKTLYILKGGSGCGKSTFMRRISNAAQEKGLDVEEVYCSADPSSLDALYLPALKLGYVDGTAPHLLEPKFAGVFEQYLNLGANYNIAGLHTEKASIMDQIIKGKAPFKRAYDYLAASDKVWREIITELTSDDLTKRLVKRSRGIIARELRQKSKHGTQAVKNRFITSLTHKGYSNCFHFAENSSDRIYHLDNSFGFAHIVLSEIKQAALSLGYNLTVCNNPLQPTQIAHLIIPELQLAFLSSDDLFQYTGKYDRHMRLDAMVDADKIKKAKQRIKFSKKVRHMLIQEAISALGDAKKEHEILERYYNPYINFSAIEHLADEHIRMLSDTC